MYKRILVALDNSRAARLALDEALKMARAADGTVLVVAVVEHVIPIGDVQTGFYDDQAFGAVAHEAAEAEVKRAKERCTADNVLVMSRVIDSYGQSVPHVIVDAAAELEAELIAMGTHGHRGAGRVLLGSVAESVLRLSNVPVLAVRDATPYDTDEALASGS
ncbi:universal stress protein [Caballeronia terrestris]|uniref:Universal stress protein n=2 Tax=Caballeronia TaxID=1827195 RepID=A0A158KY37_9BURK|nr:MULTISPECIES: universal stress protein [Caballeronia]SAL61806.1 universal stress protein [Caballeronia humi]SAL86024.1 universal stress protein [Caballeronia terrestris]